MKVRGKTMAAIGAVIALISFVVLNPKPFKPAPEDPAGQDAAAIAAHQMAMAAARIEAESRNPRPTSAIVAAPRPRTMFRRPEPDEAPPTPPDGYDFVAHHGEMAKAPLDDAYPDKSDGDETAPPWMDSSNAVDALVRQAARAGRDWSFGWIWLAYGAKADDLRPGLRRLGGEVLSDAGRLVRARLPGDGAQLKALLALKAVGALGAFPAELKLPATLAPSPHEQLPVFVTLMADDPDGRWRHALEGLGAVVGGFDADIRAYAATVPHGALGAIVQADFVLAVEPVGIVEAAHDTAVPAMGADALRIWRSPGIFWGGGASVPVGVMDTGLNVNHLDISSNRNSICGANFVSANRRLADLDLWVDQDGHGTHTTGTIVGNGFADPRFAGMAPSVSDIRFAKALDQTGSGGTDSIVRAMDFLSMPTACEYAGRAGVPVRPLVVNLSLASSGTDFAGRGADQRKLDAMVWTHRQLYVVVQGNADERGFSDVGATKNSLAVGAIRDSGALARFSSHGPTADGRLAPQVVATGVDIVSPKGQDSRAEYQSASGTSSASPAVAGIAALLMDASPEYRSRPALARARLMASAIKPDAWFEAIGRFPANNTGGPGDLQSQYGLGKASARTSVLNRPRTDGWTSGSATSELHGGQYAFEDIVVPEGASRLDLVLTWDEPPADTVSNTVLNDLDLWLDKDRDCGPGACGEYSSLSRKDNVEWIIVRDPPAGLYRAKVLPRRVYADSPRSALAWTVIRGASTPNLRIEADTQQLPPGRSRLRLTLTSDAYVAAGVRLRVDCRAIAESDCDEVRLHSAQSSREDYAPGRGSGWAVGTHLTLGEIGAGESQEVEFLVDYAGSDAVRLYFTATAWNASSDVLTLKVGKAGIGVPAVPAPENDSFADALAIEGAKGSVVLDLASATTQAGEPPAATSLPDQSDVSGDDGSPVAGPATFEAPHGRPAGSAWYAWTAPADGQFRFVMGRRPAGAEIIYVDVYRGDSISGLERIELKSPENGSFFAEKGATYRVRVSNGTHRSGTYGRSAPLTLGWSPVERAANDDFDFGTAIEGAEGSASGNNEGATLESGEWFGGLAATVWHHWTAPEDGAVRFDASSGVVMAFTGERVAELRLVSKKPGREAVFPVRSGEEYHIAIAAESAYGEGAPYELTWQYVDRYAGNDDFSGAEQIGSAASSSHYVGLGGNATVEPGEPFETGVRTKWWAWTAPESGAYTWRLDDPTHAELLISAFSGESLNGLHLAGTTGPAVTSFEFPFAAVKGRRYRISVGLPNGDPSVFLRDQLDAILTWGPTPANDRRANAAPLSGAAGSAGGSSAFATIEPGERIRRVGHSSLWWSYEGPAGGWYRFYLDNADSPFALAVYEVAGDGSLTLISVSRRPASPTGIGPPSSAGPGQIPGVGAPSFIIEALFRADAGRRYLIRLGSLGEGPGGEFTLRWEETVAPVWLKYLERLSGGDTDAAGAYIDPDLLAQLSGLAFDGGGTLYVAASGGLSAFERDSATGVLSVAQTLAKDWSGQSGTSPSLLYDSRRHRLHAYGCRTWETFSTSGPLLADEGADEAGAGLCASGRAFMDTGESSVYVVERSAGLAVLDFDAEGGLRNKQTVSLPGVTDALISNGDTHVYAVTDRSLVVFERDSESGTLSEAGRRLLSQNFAIAAYGGMAISHDDAYLLVFNDSPFSNEALIFGLGADSSDPEMLDTLPLDSHLGQRSGSGCRFAAPRRATPGFGLFCDGLILGLEWHAQSGKLKLTDLVERVDRFNNAVPYFEIPRSVALSPDGKHAYLATDGAGILFFERIGNFD